MPYGLYKEYYWLKIYSPEISHGFRNFELQHMDNKTKEVKATEGKGYLTIKSRRQPKANIGTVEKVLEGIWRL